MSNNSPEQYLKKNDLVVRRVFEAPVEQVWKAWSDSYYVMKWWGPNGFSCPDARIDFREGGVSLVCMRAPQEYGGQDMYNTWSYQKIEPLQRIEFILNFADKDGNKLEPSQIGMPPGIPKDVPHVITFKTESDPSTGNKSGKTEMIVTEYGYTSEQALNISKAGLEQCLDKMAAIFL